MRQRSDRRRRDRGLVWGFVAVTLLATVLFVWLRHSSSTDDLALGRPGALAIVVIAILAAVLGAVFSYAFAHGSRRMARWALALVIAVAAGGVAVPALEMVFGPRHFAEFAVGVLLLAAAISMVVVATEVAHSRSVIASAASGAERRS